MIEKEVMGKWNFSGQLSPNLIEVYQLIIKCLIVGFLPTIKQLSIVIQSYYQGNIIFPPLNYNCVHFLLPLAIITRLLLKQNMNLDIKSPSFWNYFYCFNFMHGSTIYIINNTFVLKIIWLLDLPCCHVLCTQSWAWASISDRLWRRFIHRHIYRKRCLILS